MSATVVGVSIIVGALAVIGVVIYHLIAKGTDAGLPRCATCSIMYRETAEKPSRDCVYMDADSRSETEG